MSIEYLTNSSGEVAERSNAAVLKTVDGLNRPGVRIPPSPPESAIDIVLCNMILNLSVFNVTS